MIKDVPNIVGGSGTRARSNVPATVGGNGTLAKPGSCGAKYEVDGTLDVAVGVVLSTALGIQRVLITVEAARVVALLVAVGGHGHGLTRRAVCVAEVDVVRPEVAAHDVERGRCVQTPSIGRALVSGEGHQVGALLADAVNTLAVKAKFWLGGVRCYHYSLRG